MTAIKKKIILYIGYASCIFLMVMALQWRSSNGYCFAHEYNSKNGTTDKDGNTYLSLNIKTDNPFIVQTDEEILSDIENGYTGYVYFGYPTCPYCRNTVPVLIGVLKENGVSKVLYCNLKKYNYQFEYSSESGIIETQQGTDDYDSLPNILSGYAVPKTIKDTNGNSVDTGEKTIYVPAVIKFNDGVPVSCWQYKGAGLKLNNGQTIYDKWTDAQAELVRKSMAGILM